MKNKKIIHQLTPSGGPAPTLIEKNITANNTYIAANDNADGYNKVVVNVQPNLGTKSITANGTYAASSDNVDGYSSVTVNVAGVDYLAQKIQGTLTSYEIPAGVTEIKPYSFYMYNALTNITIPNSVTIMGDYIFTACSNLTNITIGNSVTSIGINAFGACAITNLLIPDSVQEIGAQLCKTCTSLTSVTVGSAIQNLPNQTFNACVSLSSITLKRTGTVTKLTASNAIPASSTQHVTVYVPSDLITAYQTSTNWSTLYNNGYITFSAIS